MKRKGRSKTTRNDEIYGSMGEEEELKEEGWKDKAREDNYTNSNGWSMM